MLKTDAVSYFGSSAEIARQLGISTSAVAQWGEVVPARSAVLLEELTRGKLQVCAEMYSRKAGGKAA